MFSDPTEIDSDEEHYNPNRQVTLPPSVRSVLKFVKDKFVRDSFIVGF